MWSSRRWPLAVGGMLGLVPLVLAALRAALRAACLRLCLLWWWLAALQWALVSGLQLLLGASPPVPLPLQVTPSIFSECRNNNSPLPPTRELVSCLSDSYSRKQPSLLMYRASLIRPC